MAIINALKAGNWSDTTVWPGGTLPGPTDQVQANGYIITIDQDITVASIRTTAEGGGAAGGYFIISTNGVTITTDIVCGGGLGINISNATYTVIGNIYASTTGEYEPIRTNSTQISTITIIGNVVASYGYGIYNIGIADIIVVGNVTGGINANKHGIYNQTTGSVTVTGNVTGGSGSSAYGINSSSAGSVTVTGNVTGGSGSTAYGIYNASTGTVTVTGNVTGGSGASASGTRNDAGSFSLTGNAIASLYNPGVYSYNTGVCDVIGTAIGNDWKFGDAGSVKAGVEGGTAGSIFRRVTVSAIKYGAYGAPPTSGNVFIKKTATSTATMTDNDGNLVTLVTSDSICDFPAVSDVRLNTAFDNANKIGTCAVPVAAAVSQGVPVDHTVGIAALTPQAVWEYATRTITSGGITAAQIWAELLTSILTDGSIGKLIKDNLDAAITSRVKPSDTVARVTLVDTVTTNTDMPDILTPLETIASNATSILEDTNELQTDWANGGRLDTLLDAVAVPTGTNTITITIDDGTDPIGDVAVYIYDSTNAVFITSAITNSSGNVTFYLDDGSYQVRLRKSGTTFINPEILIVSGDTTDTYSGETVIVGLPDDSDTCRVYEYCYYQDGATPLQNVTATTVIKSIPYNYDNKLHSNQVTSGIYDAMTGLLYWDIVKECRVLVTITELGINSYVEIPTTSSARLSDLL